MEEEEIGFPSLFFSVIWKKLEEKNVCMECARFFDESCDKWGILLI